MIQIYTGNGKGKTTSAVGLIIRALKYNFKLCYIHFHKEPEKWGYGEINILKKLGVDVFGFANIHPHFNKNKNYQDIRKECLKALKFIKEIFLKKKYYIVVLDEILISIRDKFLNVSEVLDIIKNKPDSVELILTGRSPDKKSMKKLIEISDLVSEIKEVKHPYQKGIISRKGIEY